MVGSTEPPGRGSSPAGGGGAFARVCRGGLELVWGAVSPTPPPRGDGCVSGGITAIGDRGRRAGSPPGAGGGGGGVLRCEGDAPRRPTLALALAGKRNGSLPACLQQITKETEIYGVFFFPRVRKNWEGGEVSVCVGVLGAWVTGGCFADPGK